MNFLRIKPGMEVCDINGDAVGTVAHVHEPPFATDEPDATREGIVEVKSGLLGLGTHYYIPRSLFGETLRDSAFLTKSKVELKELGLETKPAYLIQGKDDLDPEWFQGASVIGVTAGSSTPDYVIDEVEEWLGRVGEPALQA